MCVCECVFVLNHITLSDHFAFLSSSFSSFCASVMYSFLWFELLVFTVPVCEASCSRLLSANTDCSLIYQPQINGVHVFKVERHTRVHAHTHTHTHSSVTELNFILQHLMLFGFQKFKSKLWYFIVSDIFFI